MAIVLASKSPRRKQLLTMLGINDLKVIPALSKELLPLRMPPQEAVMSLSLKKAREVSALCSKEDIIIAADTIVELDGDILGKPEDEKAAFSMLSRLSGRSHRVFTGICVISGDKVISEYERSYVRFRELSEREIKAYIATGEPMDKAGSYGAQGKGSLFVEAIDGDFFNVMGLPLCRLSRVLEKLGVVLL